MSILLSFRTEEDVREQLDNIAGSLDRDRTWVINEAITSYLELHQWRLDEIQRGAADIKAGRTYSTEQVRTHFAKKATARKKK